MSAGSAALQLEGLRGGSAVEGLDRALGRVTLGQTLGQTLDQTLGQAIGQPAGVSGAPPQAGGLTTLPARTLSRV